MNPNNLNPYLTAYWALNETSGMRSDCVNSLKLVPQRGSLSYDVGKFNNAAAFIGDAYLRAAHNDLLGRVTNTRGFMFSAWVLFDSGEGCIIVEKDPYFKISTGELSSSGRWVAEINGDSFNTSTWDTVTTERWYHVFLGASRGKAVFVTRSSGGRYYDSFDIGSLSTSASYFNIGEKMKGRIDEVAFWYSQQFNTVDEFLSLEDDIYQGGHGAFYDCNKSLWQIPVTVNGVTTYPSIKVQPNTERTLPLSRVQTYNYASGSKSFVSDASNKKATTGGIHAGALSFGNLAPGETTETAILKLSVPDAIIIRNIRLGLVDTGGISFSSERFGVGTLEYLDVNATPNGYFTGLNNDNPKSANNVSIPVDGRNSSVYVYLNINVPKNFTLTKGVMKLKWYFDWS